MNGPPRIARRILELALPQRVRAGVLGDLDEEYHERMLPRRGARAARRWYRRQVLQSLPHALRFARSTGNTLLSQGDGFMVTFLRDLKYAGRMMVRNRTFSLIAVLTLACGIGANTAVFSVVQAVLFRPLPYEEPERLVMIWGNLTARDQDHFPVSPIDLEDYAENTTQFDGFVGVTSFEQTLTGADREPEQLSVAFVTDNFDEVLGVRPILGRPLGAEDSVPFSDDVENPPPDALLLGYDLWQRRFGGDPEILGQIIDVNGNSREIVGVMPPGAKLLLGPESGVATEPDAWSTRRINASTWQGGRRNVTWRVIARMKPGVTLEQAQSEMDGVAIRIRQEVSVFETAGYRLDVIPMLDDLTAAVRPMILALLGGVGFVLLIACANVANLLLVRASTREREVAIRSALGGGRGRLVQLFLAESLMLASAGAALGLLLAYWGIQLLLTLQPENLPRIDTVAIDGPVLGFTLLAALGSAVVFGTVPAFQLSRPNLAKSLSDRSGSAQSGQRIFRNGLIVVEIALSVVLLVGAGLMIRSFIALGQVDPGYDPENVLTFQTSLPGGRYSGDDERNFYRTFRERLEAIPGVVSVSTVYPLLLDGDVFTGRYGTEEALTDETLYGQGDYRIVEPGYLETMGTRLLEGRTFSEVEFIDFDAAKVAMIDDKMAQILWPGESAVGKRIVVRTGGDPESIEVIGVVEHQRAEALGSDGREALYLTNRLLGTMATMKWVVRTEIDPHSVVPDVGAALGAVDNLLPMTKVLTMEEVMADSMAPTRFALVLISVFSIIALVLASVGIYGVLSFTVRQRTGEIGIRIALGAEKSGILWMIARQGVGLTLIGLAGGLTAAFWATEVLSTVLVGVTPTDPLTFSGIAAGFLAVALVACFVPAYRATRVDPILCLRYE